MSLTQELDQASRDLARRHNNLGLECLRQGRSIVAVQYFEEALESLADAEDSHESNLARLESISSSNRRRTVDLDQLRTVIEGLAEERRADYSKVLYNLASALRNGNLHSEALAALESAVRLQPNSPLLHFAMALQYDLLGQHQKALDLAQRIEALGHSDLANTLVEHLAERAGYDPVFEDPDFPTDAEYWQLRSRVTEKLLYVAEIELEWHSFL